MLDRELFVEFQEEDKLEKLEFISLSSMGLSNRIIPPSETRNLEFQGLDPVRLLNLRGGTPRSVGNFPETLDVEVLGLRVLGTWTGRTKLAGAKSVRLLAIFYPPLK